MKQHILISIFCISISSYAQIANTPSNLNACDDNYDGILTFDLTVLNFEILGGQSPSDYILSYHESMADAGNNINQINPSAYTVISSMTIYARVTEQSSGNYDTTSFDLVVHPIPNINQPSPYAVCDDDNDGAVTFDLSSKTNEIIGTETDVEVSYYLTQIDAQTRTNALNVSYNSNLSNQIIYARIEKIITSCFVVTTLELVIQDCRDEDSDGVINSDEDVNGNGNLDDDDTDDDGTPDYLDSDDDGDNIDTADELIDQSTTSKFDNTSKTSSSIIIDTDNDTIENYLDDDDDGDGVLTKDEDYNNNGTPLDDDTNNNSIPDYLEKNVALSITGVENINFLLYPNPTKDVLYINTKLGIKIEKIQLYSITGKLLFNNKNNKEVSLRHFPKGIYILNIISDNNNFTKKIIKN